MKKIFFLIASLLFVTTTFADNKKKQADAATEAWEYEIETVGKTGSTDYVLKVWSYSKDSMIAEEQSKKNAVHAVVFKGVTSADRIPGLKALVSDPVAEEANADFFREFFADGGDYMKFVTRTNSGFAEVVKLAKVKKSGKESEPKKFKIGLTVRVNVPALRKHLEQKGVIRSLSSGF